MKIEPNMLCWLTNHSKPEHARFDGWVVTTVAHRAHDDRWEITAHWLKREFPQYLTYSARPWQLVPINNPGLTDELERERLKQVEQDKLREEIAKGIVVGWFA